MSSDNGAPPESEKNAASPQTVAPANSFAMRKNGIAIAALLLGVLAVAGVVAMEIVSRNNYLATADAAMSERGASDGKAGSFTENHFNWTYTRMLNMLVGVCGWTAVALAALSIRRGDTAAYAYLAGGMGVIAIAWSSPALGIVVVVLVAYHFFQQRKTGQAS